MATQKKAVTTRTGTQPLALNVKNLPKILGLETLTDTYISVHDIPDDELGPVSGDRYAEMGLIFLAYTMEEFDCPGVQEEDFFWHDTKFLWREYLRMKGEGILPHHNKQREIWFKRPDVIKRIKVADLNWFDDAGALRPFDELFQLVIDGGFATLEHVEWHVSEVRKWRVKRGVRYLAYRLTELMDADMTDEALSWAEQAVNKLQALAAGAEQETKDSGNPKEN